MNFTHGFHDPQPALRTRRTLRAAAEVNIKIRSSIFISAGCSEPQGRLSSSSYSQLECNGGIHMARLVALLLPAISPEISAAIGLP